MDRTTVTTGSGSTSTGRAAAPEADAQFARAALDHRDLLLALARQVTRSPAEADDVVQETYLRALQGWRRDRPRQVRPWLVAICRNVIRSRHRRRSSRPAEILDPGPGATLPASQDTAEEAVARLTAELVRAAVRRLPPTQREAVVLMDLCGFTAAEVARRLDAPRGTVLARVHRGHRRLAVLLSPPH